MNSDHVIMILLGILFGLIALASWLVRQLLAIS